MMLAGSLAEVEKVEAFHMPNAGHTRPPPMKLEARVGKKWNCTVMEPSSTNKLPPPCHQVDQLGQERSLYMDCIMEDTWCWALIDTESTIICQEVLPASSTRVVSDRDLTFTHDWLVHANKGKEAAQHQAGRVDHGLAVAGQHLGCLHHGAGHAVPRAHIDMSADHTPLQWRCRLAVDATDTNMATKGTTSPPSVPAARNIQLTPLPLTHWATTLWQKYPRRWCRQPKSYGDGAEWAWQQRRNASWGPFNMDI